MGIKTQYAVSKREQRALEKARVIEYKCARRQVCMSV